MSAIRKKDLNSNTFLLSEIKPLTPILTRQSKTNGNSYEKNDSSRNPNFTRSSDDFNSI